MGDLLNDANEWLAGQFRKHLAHTVIYCRGNEELPVQATVGRTRLQINDAYGGVRMEWTDRDFLIAAEDLVFDGQAVLPQRGDRIRETRDARVLVYEVTAPAGEPEWRWSDPFGKLLRIHTKQVDVEV
jgi:hypothetical protein